MLADNRIDCSPSVGVTRAMDGVVDASTVLRSKTSRFTAADVGQRIRLSYRLDWLDTVIDRVVDTETVVLRTAPKWSATDVMVVVGTSFGIGVSTGPSQNALQQQILHLQYSRCAIGVDVKGGNVQVVQLSGGQSDVGMRIGGFGAQNTSVDFYASEYDFQAIVVESGHVAPVTISNGRYSNSQQLSSGHVVLAGFVSFTGNLFHFKPPAGGVLIGRYRSGGSSVITSVHNVFPATWKLIGYDSFPETSLTSIGDRFDGTGAPGQHVMGCWNTASPCLNVANRAPHAGNVSAVISTANQYPNNATDLVGVEALGAWDRIHDYTAFKAVGPTGAFAGTAIGFDVQWPNGINAGTWGSGHSPQAIYGYRVGMPAFVAGTLPAIYGLYIDRQKTANVQAGWGVYQVHAADQNFFGGPVLMQRNAPTATAPGEGALKLEVVCGTQAGTARLIAYAGASKEPKTILDNIGAGVAGC